MFVITLLTTYFYYVLKHQIELILFGSVVIGTPIINQILKQFFHRARPDLHRLIEIGGYSFPSGHAMNAFAVYGIITFLLWRHIPSRLGRTILILISSGFIIMMVQVEFILVFTIQVILLEDILLVAFGFRVLFGFSKDIKRGGLKERLYRGALDIGYIRDFFIH